MNAEINTCYRPWLQLVVVTNKFVVQDPLFPPASRIQQGFELYTALERLPRKNGPCHHTSANRSKSGRHHLAVGWFFDSNGDSLILSLSVLSSAGPRFIGILFNWSLLGILTVQVYIFYLNFPKDSRLHKALGACLKSLMYSSIEFIQCTLYISSIGHRHA